MSLGKKNRRVIFGMFGAVLLLLGVGCGGGAERPSEAREVPAREIEVPESQAFIGTLTDVRVAVQRSLLELGYTLAQVEETQVNTEERRMTSEELGIPTTVPPKELSATIRVDLKPERSTTVVTPIVQIVEMAPSGEEPSATIPRWEAETRRKVFEGVSLWLQR
jgi:hypothetical protein